MMLENTCIILKISRGKKTDTHRLYCPNPSRKKKLVFNNTTLPLPLDTYVLHGGNEETCVTVFGHTITSQQLTVFYWKSLWQQCAHMYVFRKVCIIKQYPNTTTNHLLPALIICSERAHAVENNFARLDNKKSICLPSKLRVVQDGVRGRGNYVAVQFTYNFRFYHHLQAKRVKWTNGLCHNKHVN